MGLGALLYLFYSFASDDITQQRITITPFEVSKLNLDFKTLLNRKPNADELKNMIQKKYFDKILLQEALTLKLAQKSPKISQKLREQMHFIMLNSMQNSEPDEKMLYQYYKQHIEDYSQKNSLSFSYIFFETLDESKIDAISNLLDIKKVQPLNQKSEIAVTNQSVTKRYGKYFSLKLFQLKKGEWHGPLRAKDGLHFVYIYEVNSSTPYPFDDVEERVYQDYLRDQKEQAFKQSYEKIAVQYTLEQP